MLYYTVVLLGEVDVYWWQWSCNASLEMRIAEVAIYDDYDDEDKVDDDDEED